MWISRFTTLAGRLDARYIERHRPRALGVELTTRCAFRCVHCPKGQAVYQRPQGQMSPDTLRLLLDQVREVDLDELALSSDGDPSSLPEATLLDYLGTIDAALGRHVRLAVVSNLAGLTDAGMRAVAALERPLKVVVDLYGARPETIQRLTGYPRGADLLEKARSFLALLAQRRQPTETHAQAFANELDPEEQREFREAWQGFHPDHHVHVSRLYAYPGLDFSHLGVPRPPEGLTRYPCIHPFVGWNVNFDGAVPICCLSYGGGIVGNIHELPLAAIWRGEKLTEARERLLRGDLGGLPCRRCDNWWFSERAFFPPHHVVGCLRELRRKLRP